MEDINLNLKDLKPTVKLPDVNEKEHESDVLDEEIDDECKAESYEGYNGSGRTVTLQMLLAANVLQPGKSTMTIEYLGQKFVGDLLADGKIKSQETETIFLSPSAWAMHCKRIINPEKKSGCGWASVKYKGKKLDAYKATWMRKCALLKELSPSEDENDNRPEKKENLPPMLIKRALVQHNSISNRNIMHDANTLIEAIPFSSLNKMQPFLLSISSSALLVADFHCHLTFNEVCGYLGGTWDINSHTLIVSKAYPCRNSRSDREKSVQVELEIQKLMIQDQLILVGWYHSHPTFQAQPTLRDCDSQLDYQIKMRGPSDVTYTPCIGLIFSPYYDENPTLETGLTPFWVVPPPESRQMFEYGRPMYLQYSVLLSNEFSQAERCEIQRCVEYYDFFRNELIDFSTVFKDDVKYIEKLKTSLFSKFAKNQSNTEFWNWICTLLKCELHEEFIPPVCLPQMEFKDEKKYETKEEFDAAVRQEKSAAELKVLSLQEQLCLPSGLNMNPSRLCSPLAVTLANSFNNTTTSSPRDSPITIPSNSASPAKFEIPVRASPSPAKSDASSNRTRNSPVPSPGKCSISDMSRTSPSVTPNKYDTTSITSDNDVMAANLASLAGHLPSNFLSNDLNTFFQQQKDYGSSSLNQLAAAAAKVGNKTIYSENCEKTGDAYPSSFNVPGRASDCHSSKSSAKQDTKLLKTAQGSSYKTKLMKELEDLKNDPIKISELMRSPEYAALLLQQAEALGATTLGTLGFGGDFSFLSNTSKKNSADYTNLLQASKLLGYDAYMQQTKSNDLNTLFQQQMNNSKKQQDYTAILHSYSKLFDSTNPYSLNKAGSTSSDLSTLLSSGNMTSSKKKDSNDVLNHILQGEKNSELNALLYHQNKGASDLNALFASPSSSSKANMDASCYYSQLTQEKMQDYAALFQQNHGKYGIPDPLSKSTLAANNLFMSPSTILKLQQDSLNAMMMKPPKCSGNSSSTSRARESSASPAQERLTPTKGMSRESPNNSSNAKYNFSAVDLAISSVASSTPSPSPSDTNRRPSDTPPVDLSRLFQDAPLTKKRMEFSSIADLAAPPSKIHKGNDRDDILNLSSMD